MANESGWLSLRFKKNLSLIHIYENQNKNEWIDEIPGHRIKSKMKEAFKQ